MAVQTNGRKLPRPEQVAAAGKDPYIGLLWWVEVEGIQVATFAECSGLAMETEFHEYREGGVNTHTRKFPGPSKYSNLVLRRGMSDNPKLWEWYLEVVRLGQQGKAQRRAISVKLYTHGSDQPVRQWTFIRAFPVKWTGPELRADGGAIAIETLEFAHEGLSQT